METPEDRSRSARYAALVRHSRGNTIEATKPARSAYLQGFERAVDPDGVLDPAERAKRAQRALRAHMLKLARKSAAVRAKRNTKRRTSDPAGGAS